MKLLVLISVLFAGCTLMYAQTNNIYNPVTPRTVGFTTSSPKSNQSSTLIIMDYQDFSKLVKKTEDTQDKMAKAMAKSAAIGGSEGQDAQTVSMEQTDAQQYASADGKYAAVVNACLNASGVLLKQPYTGIVPTPAIKETTVVLVISTDNKISACSINQEDVGNSMNIPSKLTPLPDLDSVDLFVKSLYNM